MPTPRIRTRSDGTVYHQVPFRQAGKQTSRSFEDPRDARQFARNVERLGVDKALELYGLELAAVAEITLTEWLTLHVDGLTGVEPGTLRRYRAYITNDIAPTIGHLPLSSVTDTTIGRWVQEMTAAKASGKTIQNKHGFLSGALKAAVKAKRIPTNPCDDRRLPRGHAAEMVFLDRAEFDLLVSHIPHDRWKNLATWLAATGMRFSEAAALGPTDINPTDRTCRISKSWKYTGTYESVIGPPKSRKSVRTINLPQQALDVVDLHTASEFLFTNGAGSPVRAQEFHNLGWRPGRNAAIEAGLTKRPRVHDLRHTCASWMIAAGVPLPVIQAHLGHENITTTIGTYGHLDRRTAQAAADAISRAMG